MLTASFCFSKHVTDDQERALWGRGILSWALARQHLDEVTAVLGQSRAGKLGESLAEAEAAVAKGDAAWLKAAWPLKETWRLWEGWIKPEQIAFVDIETTGLTPGLDQITVIGLADGLGNSRAFVAGRPQPGDEPLDRFREAIKAFKLVVTYNGDSFDLPFIEKHFKDQAFRFEVPTLDIMWSARAVGLTGGLKDMEKQLGITRGGDIAGMRGQDAIRDWGLWRSAGDLAAYKRLTTYCKTDCVNLFDFSTQVYLRRWQSLYTSQARPVDFSQLKGEQLTIF